MFFRIFEILQKIWNFHDIFTIYDSPMTSHHLTHWGESNGHVTMIRKNTDQFRPTRNLTDPKKVDKWLWYGYLKLGQISTIFPYFDEFWLTQLFKKKYFERPISQPFFDIFSSSWTVLKSTHSEVSKTVLENEIWWIFGHFIQVWNWKRWILENWVIWLFVPILIILCIFKFINALCWISENL